MLLEREHGGNIRSCVRYTGSFRVNGTSTPDDLRDGNSNMVTSVVRNSAGLFTVTLHESLNGQVPQKPFIRAELAQVAAPTQAARAAYVVDSWSQANRTFQVRCLDYDTPSAVDPDDNDVITFEIVGSTHSAGTD